MSKQVVQKWYQALPSGERDLPLILLNGIVYTPTAAYNEVMRDSAIATQLQTLIESGRFGTSAEDEQAIAKTRLEQWLQTQPDKPLFATLSNKVFTPSQLLEEIQSGSDIGNQWTNNEIKRMQTLMQLR